ncbi:MAG: hypothetical protein IPN54_07735 [Bacteroidetes bacterium]|nr:hypothetical protein [Bacteroidota bacterium]
MEYKIAIKLMEDIIEKYLQTQRRFRANNSFLNLMGIKVIRFTNESSRRILVWVTFSR